MEKDKHIIELLKKQNGSELKIVLPDNKIISVWNIVWGYDAGDEFAHITTNISPRISDATNDFFYSNEIEAIYDKNNEEIFKR